MNASAHVAITCFLLVTLIVLTSGKYRTLGIKKRSCAVYCHDVIFGDVKFRSNKNLLLIQLNQRNNTRF